MLSYFDSFFEKFSKKKKNIYFWDFFREFILFGNPFLTIAVLLVVVFWSDISALTPGIHRLARVCTFAQASSARSCPLAFAPGQAVYVVAGHPPGWRAARPMISSPVFVFFDVLFFAASCLLRLIPPVLPAVLFDVCFFIVSLSSPVLRHLYGRVFFRRLSSVEGILMYMKERESPYFFLHSSRRLPFK